MHIVCGTDAKEPYIFGADGYRHFWWKLPRPDSVVAARRSRSFAILSFVFWFSSLYFKKRFYSFFAFLLIRLPNECSGSHFENAKLD